MVTVIVQIGLAAGVLVCVFKVGVGEGQRRERLRSGTSRVLFTASDRRWW